MAFLSPRLSALHAWFQRRTAFLSHPRAHRYAAVLVPLLCGLLTLWSGQDDNWDLRNYHWHNAYAQMHGRIAVDMAPSGFQTYFNPTLDLPSYLLTIWFSAPLAGFVFGVLHGLNFVLLFAIAHELLGRDRGAGSYRWPLLLAAAGSFGPGFVSELGNSMGDNSTAVLVLLSVWIALRYWDALQHWGLRAASAALGSGLAMGLATGLKLTNATYAAALCLALLALPLGYWRRLRMAFVFGLGVLAGIGATAGWWFWKMWQMFGNPLFPQFNQLFHGPLAQESGVLDTGFLPKSVAESLLWPVLFWLDPRRVSELQFKLALWPVVYLLFVGWAAVLLWQQLHGRRLPAPAPRSRFLLLFFGLAYLAWMKLFSIYRYLIPLELLAPLIIFLLLLRLVPAPGMARQAAGYLLAALALCGMPAPNWGHVGWSARGYSVELPPLPAPASTLVFFAQPDPPLGWLASFFPDPVKFISVGTGFPESPQYRAQVAAQLAARPGPHYVILPTAKNDKEATLRHKLDAARMLGWTDSVAGCARLRWLSQRVRLQAAYRDLAAGSCTLDLLPQHQVDLAAIDAKALDNAARHVGGYGLLLDKASCRTYAAAVGREPYPYRLCRVSAQAGPQAAGR